LCHYFYKIIAQADSKMRPGTQKNARIPARNRKFDAPTLRQLNRLAHSETNIAYLSRNEYQSSVRIPGSFKSDSHLQAHALVSPRMQADVSKEIGRLLNGKQRRFSRCWQRIGTLWLTL
jgi:hypothetical protein